MWRLTVFGLALCCPFASIAQADDLLQSGAVLNNLCRAQPGTAERNVCESYLAGYLAGLNGAVILHSGRFNTCLPKGLDAAALADLVGARLRDSPDAANETIRSSIAEVLNNSYSCKQP